jgi:hypothetical protein
MANFAVKCVNSWSELTKAIEALEVKGRWIFRGQAKDWPLATSLERALGGWKIELSHAPGIEHQLVREFKRKYDGEDGYLAERDTLYCLTLMQHHGAPTRLLDCTYSPFVAAQFAIGEGSTSAVLWCVNASWCHQVAEKVVGKKSVALRNIDQDRDDTSFTPLFMSKAPKKFVLPENPMRLSHRLIIQQGVFLCPGDISDTFINNLMDLPGYDSEKNILKVQLAMSRNNLLEAAAQLRRMNVDSATLFPGLDGFARSLKERLPHYHDYAKRSVGLPR